MLSREGVEDEDRKLTPKLPETPQDTLELLRAEKQILRIKINNLAMKLATGEERSSKSNMEMGMMPGKDVKTMTTDELNREIEMLTKDNAELEATYENLKTEKL